MTATTPALITAYRTAIDAYQEAAIRTALTRARLHEVRAHAATVIDAVDLGTQTGRDFADGAVTDLPTRREAAITAEVDEAACLATLEVAREALLSASPALAAWLEWGLSARDSETDLRATSHEALAG